MLHVMQTDARPMPDGVLRAMFAARKSVFVDLLKWDVPVIDGTYEVDQFDDTHATYLVLADGDGGHLASARLLPTTRPHILDSFYGELCEEAPPQAPDVFEITRFCLDRDLSARERRAARDTLVRRSPSTRSPMESPPIPRSPKCRGSSRFSPSAGAAGRSACRR